ncbi:CDP-glycerol glycerophosphotransferase family protein [Lactococcus lactis]
MKNFVPREYYSRFYEQSCINSDTILYESRDGSTISDSPLALFLSLANNKDYANFQHVWVVKDKLSSLNLINVPESLKSKITFVERNSKEYVDYMLTAKYLITNSTFQSWFSKKEEQVYINTWHGTPLKSMGFDIENQLGNTQNVLRNLLMTDYFLSPNPHTTEIFAGSGYKMRGIYKGEIIESGYPRIDLTKETSSDDAKNLLKELGIELDSTLPVVVYMPTWRGNDTQNPSDSIAQVIAELKYLRKEFLGKYNIILKVHPYLYKKAKNYKELSGILIDDAMDANLVLAATDILITDFSSVFFDYLVTDKPIIFYAWDQDIYSEDRGMYLDMAELPGPILKTVIEIADYLSDIDQLSQDYLGKYLRAKEKYVPYDDGNVSKRVVNYIFKKEKSSQLVVKKIDSEKEKLLFYPGNLDNNGITQSFINLTNALDYQKYDVTVFTNTPKSHFFHNYQKLNKNIRLIFRTGSPNFSEKEQMLHDKINKSGHITSLPEVAFKREAHRLFSGLSFDKAIDFSGYSFYWSKFVAFSDSRVKMIFQHNDLYAEMTKEIDGKFPHKKLTGVFELYHYFDKVISVSKALMTINSHKLSKYLETEQLDYLPNLIFLGNDFVSEKKEEALLNLNGIYSFINSEIRIFQNPKVNSVFEVKSFSKNEIVKVLSTKKVQDIILVKILVNDIYLGWVEFSELKFSGNETKKVVKVKKVASIVKKQNFLIYQNIPNFFPGEKDEAVTETKYVTQQYWFVNKVLFTKQGKVAYISNGLGIKGWVRYGALNRFHNLANKPYLALGFLIHNLRNKCLTSSKITFEKYQFKLRKNSTSYYSRPKGLKFSKKLEAGFLNKSLDYSTDEQQMVKGTWWVKTYNNGKFVCWLKLADIELIDGISSINESENSFDDIIQKIVSDKKNKIPQFVNVARLSPEKNQKVLIEAFAKLKTIGVEAKLYILGSGILKEELETKIIELNLSDSVQLLGHIENIRNFLPLMDYFIFPSLYEGQGMALLEAMSVGLLPIVSDIPTSREIVAGGNYGIISESNDEQGLALAMMKALKKEEFSSFDLESYNKNVINRIKLIL